MTFAPGQRWISIAEPELGLGTVLRVDGRTLQIVFAASGTLRAYAAQAAPLQRAEFRVGDKVSGSGRNFSVVRIEQHDGVLVYHGETEQLAEGELDDVQDLSKADERLISGRVDRADRFDFRVEALTRRAQARRSPAWGLMSARVDLIPHQLRVADVATSRRPVRVLLADEVGLGKTIEAGMILARLLATGRIGRVLILLPETLIYQWFVELLRRFNLQFAIFDEERCEAIEQDDPQRNPFLDEQLVLAERAFVSSGKRAQQASSAGWDCLIVDEAHHLEWSESAASDDYLAVERLAASTPNLVLLTATPEQLGRSGHFARLRLLDSARYRDLAQFQREADGYAQLSHIVEKLIESRVLDRSERNDLAERLHDDPALLVALENSAGDSAAAQILLDALIDRHGTGRVMFRNRRSVVGGFPNRVANLYELDASLIDDDQRQHLLAEFMSDVQQPPSVLSLDYSNDPRLPWLLALIEGKSDAKFLLICRTQAKVIALEDALRTRSGVKIARFHESMTIVQRDRNAAYFAEGDGARLLLCAEIGSEGRNFQFAHHLILWDLPLDPDLLEQRIGRLDRIGQRADIQLHCAAFSGSAQQVLMRWYDAGLDAFRNSPADGRELYKRFGERLVALAVQHARGGEDIDSEIDVLTAETRAAHEDLSAQIHTGRDRLLELANRRESHAHELERALELADEERTSDDFVLRLFEQFGIENDDQGRRTYLLDPEYVSVEGFPGLKDGKQMITFARDVALVREEVPLLGPDHPMVIGALDLLLGGDIGSVAFLVDASLPARTALIEAIFILDGVAAPKLHVDRYLPPFPMRRLVDSKLAAVTDWKPGAGSVARATERPVDATRYRKFLTALVPPMLKRCSELARVDADAEIARALALAEREIGAEHARLSALRRVNSAVSAQEIDALSAELAELRRALPKALLRLDCVRFVCSPDFLGLR